MKSHISKSYEDAMRNLNDAAYAAVRAATREGNPTARALRNIAAEIDCMIDHGVTREDLEKHKRLQDSLPGGAAFNFIIDG